MEIGFLAALALVAVVIGVVELLNTREAGREVRHGLYASLTSMEEKRLAIESARSVRELEQMWEAWEHQGLSQDGLLHAELLQRKGELVGELSETERARVREADAAWKAAKNLPVIKGRART